ncbi:uncharacterized protein [Chelonus insularis]|uniref:uncharacterized protein n=1 Tax=Chelonus insularis TaxID=460826 RepID=UPI00158D111A|nr:uncharacterized protein LOC118066691 [Chelonus insularis]
MSQRDSSPSAVNNDINQRNLKASNKLLETPDDEEDSHINHKSNHPTHPAELSHLHRSRNVESPLHSIVGSIRHSRTRPNHSPIFSDSTYSSGRMDLSDLADINPTNSRADSDSQKSRLYYPQNHQNNAHCQRTLLPADSPYLLQQHLVNESDVANDRTSHRHCTMDEQRHRKHADERSISPTSSSDAAEVLTSPRQHSRHKQHSSHRHRPVNSTKDHLYHGPISSHQLGHQHSPAERHRQTSLCHRYHEIGQPTSCSPVCDSGIREDDASSSAPSNHRDRLSSCDDVSAMCSLVVTATTTTTTMSTNLPSPLPIASGANYHHRASSGISCESSTSSSIRNHGTHENCMTDRHRNPARHNHVIQPYALDPPQRVQIVHARETKSPLLIGLDTIQMSTTLSKNKCHCHIDHIQQQMQLQQHQQEQHQHPQQSHQPHHHHHHYHQHPQYNNQDKRGPEGESNDTTAVTSIMHQPPALPPRPPPRPNRRYDASAYDLRADNGEGSCCKKYVVLCCLCGGLSAAVGCLFLAVHAVLTAHTASLALFETVPSYIPGTMLILMGLFTMLLARRKHRYSLLMKVCGSVGVVCALVCVLVTVTTTVVHMSRLQGLRECVYTARARSCTCYGAPQGRGGDPGVLFEGTPHCEAVHGALYDCLRALFGVSVAGILACIFSCMLVYQLLSHEKKKMYWEQLELRCRSLYGHGGGAPMSGAPAGSCGCCNDCGGVNPWWAQTPGNLYTPNPDLAPSRRWRLPWSRSRGPAPSPDSNYGFHAQSMRHAPEVTDSTRDNTTAIPNPYGLLDTRQPTTPYSVLNGQNTSYTASTGSYSVLETPVPLWGPPPPYSDPNSPARRPQIVEPKVSSSGASTTPSTPAIAASPAQLPPPNRIIKRTGDIFDNNEDHHPPRALQHCPPSDNYENTEEISTNTDAECSGVHEGAAMKRKRSRRNLKGVENDGFQKESNNQMTANKQSESELYFGDVSSCCGPESSLYELAVEKESTGDEAQQQTDYMQSRMSKHRLSKRSRLPLPLLPPQQQASHQDLVLDTSNDRNYSNGDETIASAGGFLAPDAQYEVIQQSSHYGYYMSQEDEYREAPSTYAFYPRDAGDAEAPTRDYRGMIGDEENERNASMNAAGSNLDENPSHEMIVGSRRGGDHQCCSTSNVSEINTEWKNVEQSKSEDGVCPINV